MESGTTQKGKTMESKYQGPSKMILLDDGNFLTAHWSGVLDCYVTIPDDDETITEAGDGICPVCGFTRDNHYDWFCNGFEN